MKILIAGLNQGLTHLSEEISPDFLETRWHEFYPEPIRCDVEVDRFLRELRVKINLSTAGHYTCDRCLEEFSREHGGYYEQIYKIGEGPDAVDDEVIQLPADTVEIDLTGLIQEILILHHPLKMLCKEDCAGLCPGCGADLNKEACTCREGSEDPRWAQLRKLLK
ncbi:MAG TPA: DUF177 domain-containing protein [Caldithrix abyssi]|uniref:DUF177 domain-containing protein n=1 Tax=Caldithrix abyssi TaxID=187145 RepID=A0A7V5RQ21_CALAY|nr:DUF177 domain-containing protein [Caldithrix abyssi]